MGASNDPIGASGQSGIWTDEVLKGVGVGLPMVNGLYYDPQSGQYFDRANRFKSAYEPVPFEGQNVLRAFEVMSYVPVVGAPFNVVLGIGDIQDGHPFMGALRIGLGFADAGQIAGFADAAKGGYSAWKMGQAATREVGEVSGAARTITNELAEEAGAASVGKNSISRGDLEPKVWGSIDKDGNITIAKGLNPTQTSETLRHEEAHLFFMPLSQPFGRFRMNIADSLYERSHLLRYSEEAIAEAWGTRSLRRGFAKLLKGGYNLSKSRIAAESVAWATAVTAGGIYLGNRR